MKTYDVKVINAGTYEPVPEPVLYADGDIEKSVPLPSLIFALTAEDGEVIICDASFGDPDVATRVMADTPYPVTVTRDKPLPDIMRENGIEPNDVKTLILSHHHWDHAGGVYHFPNATVYIQKADWEFAEQDANYGPEFKEELNSFRDRLVLVDGRDNTTFDGIEMVPVGAHTVGSQMLFVNTKKGIVCLGFDVIMCPENITRKVPIGLCMNPEEAQKALDMVLDMGCDVYCGHDPRVAHQN